MFASPALAAGESGPVAQTAPGQLNPAGAAAPVEGPTVEALGPQTDTCAPSEPNSSRTAGTFRTGGSVATRTGGAAPAPERDLGAELGSAASQAATEGEREGLAPAQLDVATEVDTEVDAEVDAVEVETGPSATDHQDDGNLDRTHAPHVERSRHKFAWPPAMGLVRSSALETGRALSAPSWGWREVAGRLCELAGGPAGATLSCAASLTLDAQQRGENVAWIQTRDSSFLPQDLHACGIDLDALVVVRPPHSKDLGLAAEWIARSGAFGLVVLDLTSVVRTPMAMQARLLALAKKYDLALVCLTEKSPQHASLSSLVSLRVDTTVRRPAPAHAHAAQRQVACSSAPTASGASCKLHDLATFECEWFITKDKRRSQPWRHTEARRGPPGLR